MSILSDKGVSSTIHVWNVPQKLLPVMEEAICILRSHSILILSYKQSSASMAEYGSATADGVREFLYGRSEPERLLSTIEVRSFSRQATTLLSGMMDTIHQKLLNNVSKKLCLRVQHA